MLDGVIYYEDVERSILKVININDIILIRSSPHGNGYQFHLKNNSILTLNISKDSLDKFIRSIQNVHWLDAIK